MRPIPYACKALLCSLSGLCLVALIAKAHPRGLPDATINDLPSKPLLSKLLGGTAG